MEQPIRSFIAIELPSEVKSLLERIENSLKSGDPSCAKWVSPESIHLTLKFLGNVSETKIEAVVQSLQKAAQNIPPFNLTIQGLGAFPNLKRPQVVWVGLAGDLVQLQTLQKQVEANVSPLGFPSEARPFTPHLTLARVRDYASPQSQQSLGDLISRTQIEADYRVPVSSISLMKSQLTRAGAVYTRLASIDLKPSC
jgi:RNA 2',3'-cyclic 3'-phosphodiesterase